MTVLLLGTEMYLVRSDVIDETQTEDDALFGVGVDSVLEDCHHGAQLAQLFTAYTR